MNVQELTQTPPHNLDQIGIRLQSHRTETQPDRVTDFENPQESLLLIGLKLQDFDQAYMVHADGENTPMPLNPQVLNQSRLLDSLQQVGQNLNLESALEMHNSATELIAAMRQAHGLSPALSEAPTPVKLVISGAFGNLELDLQKLQPEALRATFGAELEQFDSTALEQVHQGLSTLVQQVRSGFNGQALAQAFSETWRQAIAKPFDLKQLLETALGFDALNEEASVRHLLQTLDSSPEHSGSSVEGSPNPIQDLLLEERVRALIEVANKLGETLELAPTPQSLDVLDLLRTFLAILHQLDQDLNAILQSEQRYKQLERKILAHFASTLHTGLHFQAQQLDKLRQSDKERLHLLLQQALIQTQAKTWLALQTSLPLAQQNVLGRVLQWLEQVNPQRM